MDHQSRMVNNRWHNVANGVSERDCAFDLQPCSFVSVCVLRVRSNTGVVGASQSANYHHDSVSRMTCDSSCTRATCSACRKFISKEMSVIIHGDPCSIIQNDRHESETTGQAPYTANTQEQEGHATRVLHERLRDLRTIRSHINAKFPK